MTKTRADSWTDQHDELLATTVLKHIQGGSQQLRAFEEASDKLDRTSAACAFRWNATIKRRYEAELKKAFKIRRQSQNRKVASIAIDTPVFNDSVEQIPVPSTSSTSALTARYEDVIDTIQEEKRQLLEYNRMLLQENKDLKEMRDSILRILS